jgi:hypothetical protein
MQPDDFKRILSAFADRPEDFVFAHGKLLVQLRDEVIEAEVFQRDGDLWIREDDEAQRAVWWLVNRVARLRSLADRILEYIPDTPHFVSPKATFLDQPDYQASNDSTDSSNAAQTIQDALSRNLGGSTAILYLTSDAGEGKTTIINHLARTQAQRFKSQESNWLLVPIPLGGRAFMRFDDVVVAALMNRLRYRLLYFDGFTELVKLGFIVPAFDGFEEMFVEGSSGEATSALGNLVRGLSSSGSLLIAARKAYFEYQGLGTHARLLDAAQDNSVAFARVGLKRWDGNQFLQYARSRNIQDAARLYDLVSARFGPSHPLLTRAVLVRRLVDVASAIQPVDELVERLGQTPQDYFFQFVDTIVDREATEKWIDRSGEPLKPLLTTQQHHDLLALVAQEMWLAKSDSLRGDVLPLVADLFSSAASILPAASRQVAERLTQHCMLATVAGASTTFGFDHEDFFHFYLGEALGRVLERGEPGELRRFLQAGGLRPETAEAAMHYLTRLNRSPRASLEILQTVARADSPASYTRENVGLLSLRALASQQDGRVELQELSFAADALKGQHLEDVEFVECYFQMSSLEETRLANCNFVNCRLDGLELYQSTHVAGCTLRTCEIGVVSLHEADEEIYDPALIRKVLKEAGFSFGEGLKRVDAPVIDEASRLAQRALRVFLRANQVNDDVFRLKLGVSASVFFDSILPALLDAGVLQEVKYRGSKSGRRFRLTKQSDEIQAAFKTSRGSFERFVSGLRR